uniref:Uncharacterized protein n=1 Tax=Arundo donax TaxID=35708 RepID=A0A0A9GJZ1_ARUDO
MCSLGPPRAPLLSVLAGPATCFLSLPSFLHHASLRTDETTTTEDGMHQGEALEASTSVHSTVMVCGRSSDGDGSRQCAVCSETIVHGKGLVPSGSGHRRLVLAGSCRRRHQCGEGKGWHGASSLSKYAARRSGKQSRPTTSGLGSGRAARA